MQTSFAGVSSHGQGERRYLEAGAPVKREGDALTVESFRRVQGSAPPVYSYQPAGWYTSRTTQQPIYANWQRAAVVRQTLVDHEHAQAAMPLSPAPLLRPFAPSTPSGQSAMRGAVTEEERTSALLATIFQRPPEEPVKAPVPMLGAGRSTPILQPAKVQICPASPLYSARAPLERITLTRTNSFQPVRQVVASSGCYGGYAQTPPTRLPSAPSRDGSTPSLQGGGLLAPRPEVSLEATTICGAPIGDLDVTRKQEDVMMQASRQTLQAQSGAGERSPGSSVCSYSSSEAGEGEDGEKNLQPRGNPEPSAVPLPRWVEESSVHLAPAQNTELGSPFLFPDSLQSSPLPDVETTTLGARTFDFSELRVKAENIVSTR